MSHLKQTIHDKLQAFMEEKGAVAPCFEQLDGMVAAVLQTISEKLLSVEGVIDVAEGRAGPIKMLTIATRTIAGTLDVSQEVLSNLPQGQRVRVMFDPIEDDAV